LIHWLSNGFFLLDLVQQHLFTKISQMIRPILSALILVLLYGCGVSTQISGSWKEQGIQPSTYNNIAVVTITSEQGRRRMVENEIAQSLKKRGLGATPSYTIFPEGYLKSKPPKEDIQRNLENAGTDALLTVTLLDIKEENYYVPGTTSSFGPYPYYQGYYGYYSHWHPTVYQPGYYAQSTNVFLESNLYDVNSGELIWTAQSKTVDPNNLGSFADSYSSAMVRQLMKDKVLMK